LEYRNLEIETKGGIATLWLNRPEVRNALDERLIAEITEAVTALQQDDSVRVLVLAGRGKAFCAGADLNWMKRMAGYSGEQNLRDAMGLARMLRTVHVSAKPVLARVHGPAFAGGMGLAAACDIIVAEPAAEFCLSEVRIGLVPATISPYVIRALGVQAARRYMLSAERIPAAEALRIGFVHEISEEGAIDEALARIAGALLIAGPKALAQTKDLIEQVGTRRIDEDVMQETAGLIAAVRASAEGREGVSSFLEKRKPAWLAA
jgi:methylglutaconyl-CoA hydratase